MDKADGMSQKTRRELQKGEKGPRGKVMSALGHLFPSIPQKYLFQAVITSLKSKMGWVFQCSCWTLPCSIEALKHILTLKLMGCSETGPCTFLDRIMSINALLDSALGARLCLQLQSCNFNKGWTDSWETPPCMYVNVMKNILPKKRHWIELIYLTFT